MDAFPYVAGVPASALELADQPAATCVIQGHLHPRGTPPPSAPQHAAGVVCLGALLCQWLFFQEKLQGLGWVLGTGFPHASILLCCGHGVLWGLETVPALTPKHR